jgi:hypothetical protein
MVVAPLVGEISAAAHVVESVAVLAGAADLCGYVVWLDVSPYVTRANGRALFDVKTSGPKVAVNQLKA